MPHFDEALTILRDRAIDLFGMGRSFECLMQAALSREPGILGDRFERVWLWHEWPDRDGPDTGIFAAGHFEGVPVRSGAGQQGADPFSLGVGQVDVIGLAFREEAM